MFNKYYYQNQNANIDIVEKRAPTDESIRLLKEFEKEARDKIINSVRVESNILKGIILECQFDSISLQKNYIAIFNLNGEKFEIQINEPDKRFILNEDSALKLLADEMAKIITVKILTEAKK